jgi:putative acetyltransferase
MPTTTSSVPSGALASADPVRVVVRQEQPSDRAAVEALVEEAFGEASVAKLVRLIRASEHWVPELALVAERDGTVVGHVLLSTADVESDGRTRAQVLLLSPLAVLPTAQRSGVARALVEAALDRAAATRFGVVLLEGDPALYARFGFEPATALGLERPSERIPDGAWQAYRLPAYSADIRGRVVYQRAFWETGSVGPP